MTRGKQTCKILKEIRRQIAKANDIEFVTSECRYKGDCLGTCPKCEAEVRYLEQELRARSLAGRAIALSGISVASLNMLAPINVQAQSPTEVKNISLTDSLSATCIDSTKIRGKVYEEKTTAEGDTQIEETPGVVIINQTNSIHTFTDLKGDYEINAQLGDTIQYEYLGCNTETVIITDLNQPVNVIMKPSDDFFIGEVEVYEEKPIPYLDLNIIDEKGKIIDSDKIVVEMLYINEEGEEDSRQIFGGYIDDKHQWRIFWEYEVRDFDTGKPLKEATFRIEVKDYDNPVIIKVKQPKKKSRKTIKFKHQKIAV